MTNQNRLQLLHSRVFEKRINEAVAFLRQNKIEPILIKGWWAAQFYPDSTERGFSDIDLMIAPEKYNFALEVTKELQLKNPLDLHKGAKLLDTLDFAELYANSKLVSCGDGEIRVLSEEDHLRILCVHWLIDGGEKKEKLWDIYYAVKNRPADFDWNKCLNVVSQTRRRWIVCTIKLAHKYLGLDVSDTPIADEVVDVPSWIITTLEKEWASNIRLIPLEQCWGDRPRLFQQIKKRFPPNPIQATVDMEGKFDDQPRIFYQIGDIFYRLNLSVRRFLNQLRGK